MFFNGVHFDNWDKVCEFVKTYVIPQLHNTLPEYIQNKNIDIGIYSNGERNFRTVGSTKMGQDRTLKIISDHTENDSLIHQLVY